MKFFQNYKNYKAFNIGEVCNYASTQVEAEQKKLTQAEPVIMVRLRRS